jgi:hypothetical protein
MPIRVIDSLRYVDGSRHYSTHGDDVSNNRRACLCREAGQRPPGRRSEDLNAAAR